MRVAICGGASEGCAAALRTQGVAVRVYEDAAEFAPVGAGITLGYNAMQ